jgi:hypothetical protein
MSGMNSVSTGLALAATALVAVVGIGLPSAGVPDIHRIRPVVSMRQCENSGGWVEATRQSTATCRGGLEDGDPVNIS